MTTGAPKAGWMTDNWKLLMGVVAFGGALAYVLSQVNPETVQAWLVENERKECTARAEVTKSSLRFCLLQGYIGQSPATMLSCGK